MKLHICNAFSLSMLNREEQAAVPRIPRPIADPAAFIAHCRADGWAVTSAVGHADTAAVFAVALGEPVACNRVSLRLAAGECALIGQYVGPRLPEGARSLPEGAHIEWWCV